MKTIIISTDQYLETFNEMIEKYRKFEEENKDRMEEFKIKYYGKEWASPNPESEIKIKKTHPIMKDGDNYE